MKAATILVTPIIGLLVSASLCDEAKAQGPPKPPELKVLEKFVGTWDSETVAKPAEWTPKGVKTKGTKAEGVPPKPPELKILARYLGSWTTETVNKMAEWNPKAMRTTGTVTTEWVLDGRFVRMRAK